MASHYDDKGKLIKEGEDLLKLVSGDQMAQMSMQSKLDQKFIAVNVIEKLREHQKGKIVRELISLEDEDNIIAHLNKTKGLVQMTEAELIDIAVTDTLNWSQLWGSVKKMDVDHNGFIDKVDFENYMIDFYPMKCQGKSFF